MEEEDQTCYPDNWPVFEVFRAMNRQWHMTERGIVIGLRMEALPGLLDILQVPRRLRRDLFWALREMEEEAIDVLNRKIK